MNLRKRNSAGFTLLELIVVIIVLGVLAAYAIPKLFSVIEFSRSSEGLRIISAVRRALHRCYLRNSNYMGCDTADFSDLDIDDPNNDPTVHFGYSLSASTPADFTITATRNTINGGDGTSQILLTEDVGTVTKSGTGAFRSIGD